MAWYQYCREEGSSAICSIIILMYLPVSLNFGDGRTKSQTLSGIPYLVERHRKTIIPGHRECKRHETEC